VEQAKCFHELFFNGAFGRLFKGSKISEVPRQFLLKEDNSSLWNTSYIYMLLPLESTCIQDQEAVRINWKGINDSSSVVDFIRCRNLSEGNYSSDGGREAALVSESSVATDCCMSDMIHLANKTLHSQSLKNMVVMAIHTGKLYTIIDVVSGSSTHSPFETADFATFSDYFIKK